MFNLRFGLIMTLLVTPMFILGMVIPGEQRNGADMTPSLFIFLMIFEVIGLVFLFSGIKQVVIDKKTDKYGNMTYGQIIHIYGTGSEYNGKEELQAEILVYLPTENKTKKINEIIGFPPLEYNVGDFVQLKIYENDVNIVRVVLENEIPNTILTLLK